MRAYAESLMNTFSLNLPHQIIALSSEWSRGLESLLSAYFDNPLIIIANTLEASIFKKVKQCVEICASHERMDHVLSKWLIVFNALHLKQHFSSVKGCHGRNSGGAQSLLQFENFLRSLKFLQ